MATLATNFLVPSPSYFYALQKHQQFLITTMRLLWVYINDMGATRSPTTGCFLHRCSSLKAI